MIVAISHRARIIRRLKTREILKNHCQTSSSADIKNNTTTGKTGIAENADEISIFKPSPLSFGEECSSCFSFKSPYGLNRLQQLQNGRAKNKQRAKRRAQEEAFLTWSRLRKWRNCLSKNQFKLKIINFYRVLLRDAISSNLHRL